MSATNAGAPVLEIAPAEALAASSGRVDVWRLPLGPGALEPAEALHRLSAAERVRAARMRLGAGRWVAARAGLRGVLGRYLGIAPQRLAFVLDAAGKPRLAPGAPADLRFNLSHCGDVALLAVRLGREVGIDVERLRDDVDAVAVARAMFDGMARAEIAALAGARRREAFFRAWVRREALAKASGAGLAGPADDRAAARFEVCDLEGVAGCAAAVASEGSGWTLARVAAGEPVLA